MKKLFDILTRNGQGFALGLGVLVILIILIQVFTGISGNGFELGTDLNGVLKNNANLPVGEQQEFAFFDGVTIFPIVLVVLILAIIVVFAVVALIRNPKKNGIIIACVAVALAIMNFARGAVTAPAEGSSLALTLQKFDVAEGASQWISVGIMATIILIAVSVVAMVLLEIYNAFK